LSLSVCTDKVRIISPNGNLLSEGETKCSDITTLKNLGYTIEYLEEPTQVDSTTSSFEPIQEEIIQEPIIEQIETVIIQEPEIQTLVIQQQDIFDNSLVLAETNATLKANNIELTNENNNLKSELENSITQLDLNKVILQHEIDKVHTIINNEWSNVRSGSTPQKRQAAYSTWTKNTINSEIGLEQYANSLGLEYTRRAKISGETIYYTAPPIEEWVSYMPTTSATVREF
jgi:hypothetical protein